MAHVTILGRRMTHAKKEINACMTQKKKKKCLHGARDDTGTQNDARQRRLLVVLSFFEVLVHILTGYRPSTPKVGALVHQRLAP